MNCFKDYVKCINPNGYCDGCEHEEEKKKFFEELEERKKEFLEAIERRKDGEKNELEVLCKRNQR